MTQDEIIEMVMQIGGCDRPEDDSPALKMFVTFAKLVAEHEREACAKECWKQMGLLSTQAWTVNPYEQCINAIRERGKE